MGVMQGKTKMGMQHHSLSGNSLPSHRWLAVNKAIGTHHTLDFPLSGSVALTYGLKTIDQVAQILLKQTLLAPEVQNMSGSLEPC